MMKKYKLVFISLFTFLLSTNSHAAATRCSVTFVDSSCGSDEICYTKVGITQNTCQKCNTYKGGAYPNASHDTNVCYNTENSLQNGLGWKVTTYNPNADSGNEITHNVTICDATKHAKLTSDGTDCDCKKDYEYDSNQKTCTPHTKTLSLHENTGDINESVIIFYVKKHEGFSASGNTASYKEDFNLFRAFDAPSLREVLERNKYEFLGVYTTPSASGTQIFQANGDIVSGYNSTYFFTGSFQDVEEPDLYIRWKPLFKIVYKSKNPQNSDITVATYDCSSTPASCAYIIDLDQKKNPGPTGRIFEHWLCRGENPSYRQLKKANEPLGNLTEGLVFTPDPVGGINTITCIAQFSECKEGQYCDVSGVHDCPTGTTSATGSSEITQCYINGNTIFKDNAGEFSLKSIANGKIYYQSSN